MSTNKEDRQTYMDLLEVLQGPLGYYSYDFFEILYDITLNEINK